MADNSQNYLQTALAILSGGAVVAFINNLFSRRKNNAEAQKTTADAVAILDGVKNAGLKILIEGLQKRVEDLSAQLTRQEDECREREAAALERERHLHEQISDLMKQVQEQGGEIIELRKALHRSSAATA
jgi:DNA-binding transcriptional MerR regulator